VTENELYGSTACRKPRQIDADRLGRSDTLQRAISDAKERVADLAGTSPDKVRLIIEV
jgi:hypothetical protein